MLELYDYQQQAVQQLRQAYAAGKQAPLLVLPTAAGKTICFTYMTQQASLKGLRVLLLAHRKELVGQISGALKLWGAAHGIISPTHAATNHPVQVAMVQTLARRIKLDRNGRFKFDLVIIDEAHHATKDSTWGAVLSHNAGAKLLGVSATPCRLDGKGLGMHAQGFFDEIIVGPSVADLIERGRLTRPVVYAPEQSVDLSGVKVRGGDYVSGQLAAAVDKSAITGDAVKHYQRYCDRQPAIAFTVTVEHAGHVVEQFKTAGYQAAVLTGSTPDKERAQMIKDLGSGKLQILASCNVVSEGTDIPTVAAAILLRPTASYALAMQQIGRALRSSPGKDKAIILDHAGNTLKHGLPTDAVEWSLSGIAKRGKNALVKRCSDCGALIAIRFKACPECAYEFAGAVESDRDGLPVHQDGELVEMTPERLRELRKKRFKEEKQAQSVEQLAEIGKARGYQYPRQWANKRFVELHS